MMWFLVGIISAVFMGFILGSVGGGGALLSIPILVGIYKLSMTEAAAASYWILILGSSVALIPKINQVNKNFVMRFLVASTPVLFLTRQWLVPNLPMEVLGAPTNSILSFIFILIVFTVYFKSEKEDITDNYSQIRFTGKAGFVGLIGGLIGAGGGFLIVPVLMSSKKLSMAEAVATSLMVILFNSIIGVLASWNTQLHLPWSDLWLFVALAVVGALIGGITSKNWNDKILKRVFSLILLSVGIGMTLKEIINFL
ncbi:MAG: sulfite exporter TauE/SafE family protein [Bacteroidota bacterium]